MERVGPHTINVINNIIVSVNGQAYNPAITGTLPTINELFAIIKDRLAQKPVEKNLVFDPIKGYPIEVYFDMDQRVADEEVRFTVTDLIAR
jgi:hypothetical protein